MFLRNAELDEPTLSQRAGQPWYRSIAVRLAIFYGVSAFATLLVATGILCWSLINGVEQDEEQFITDKLRLIQTILRDRPRDPDFLINEVQWEASLLRPAQYFAQIADRAGNVLLQTPGGAANGLRPNSFPIPHTRLSAEPRITRWTSARGNTYLLSSALARVGNTEGKQRIIRLAVDITREEKLITRYEKAVLLVLLCGIVLSATIGIVVARRELRPLREVTRGAQWMTASRLHARIGHNQWPRELVSLVAAFDAMLARLEDAFTRMAHFAADLAHELRTPLNNLMGETEVALSRERSSDEYRRVLESNLEECNRLAQMADGLLFLARAEQPESQIERTSFSVRDELDPVVEFYVPVAEETGVAVACRGDAVVTADRLLFRRAVSNLLANALQHTLTGGEIVVSVSASDKRCVEVVMSDTGVGINPADVPRIFDRFYRGRKTCKPDAHGAGLGLAIVKSIMVMHGGSVAAESRPSQGTTIILRFPADAPYSLK